MIDNYNPGSALQFSLGFPNNVHLFIIGVAAGATQHLPEFSRFDTPRQPAGLHIQGDSGNLPFEQIDRTSTAGNLKFNLPYIMEGWEIAPEIPGILVAPVSIGADP